MKAMKAKLFSVLVRRDAHTITPTIVTEHEIPILKTIFGEECIQTPEGKLITDDYLKSAEPAGQTDVADTEFDRLTSKYGGNEDGVFVEQVYGKRATKGLEKAIESNAAAGAKKTTARDSGDKE
ncbi:hypothetical protein [Pusillimonas minor]|uniref:Uncharacterized protein n=1 Tax=Pusillimonas minor TaxID=2697024 RepID=A0A842HJV2_9BURK|nr:hypothetical protein [Pusillimonas minor]MBC2768566.1 hypothetical protein [Pusillimonas minor]